MPTRNHVHGANRTTKKEETTPVNRLAGTAAGDRLEAERHAAEEAEKNRPESWDEVEAKTKVKTKRGLPDMRIKEHRDAFMFDPNKKTDGSPDERKLINRPDLQQLHADRGEDKPNLIFTPDGEMR